MKKTLIIEGMMCEKCAARVKNALESVNGVKAEVFLADKKAVCEAPEGIDAELLSKAVYDAGYDVIEVK